MGFPLALLIANIIGAIPAIVHLVETLFGNKSGEEKKTAAMVLVQHAVTVAAASSTGGQHTTWGIIAPAISSVIESTVTAMNTPPADRAETLEPKL
jgi:hypothetical protein